MPNIVPINETSPNADSVSLATTVSLHDSDFTDTNSSSYEQIAATSYKTPERKAEPGSDSGVFDDIDKSTHTDFGDEYFIEKILKDMHKEQRDRTAEEDQLIAEAEEEFQRLEEDRVAHEEREIYSANKVAPTPKKRKSSPSMIRNQRPCPH